MFDPSRSLCASICTPYFHTRRPQWLSRTDKQVKPLRHGGEVSRSSWLNIFYVLVPVSSIKYRVAITALTQLPHGHFCNSSKLHRNFDEEGVRPWATSFTCKHRSLLSFCAHKVSTQWFLRNLSNSVSLKISWPIYLLSVSQVPCRNSTWFEEPVSDANLFSDFTGSLSKCIGSVVNLLPAIRM